MYEGKEREFFSEEDCVLRDEDEEEVKHVFGGEVERKVESAQKEGWRDRRHQHSGDGASSERFFVKELRCAVKGGSDNLSTEGQGETCCEDDVIVEDLSDDEGGETKSAAKKKGEKTKFYLNSPGLQRVLNGEEPIILLPIRKRQSVALGDIKRPQVWASKKSSNSCNRFSEKGSAVLLETRALHDLRLFLKGEMIVDSLLCLLRLRQLLELDDHEAVRRVGRQIYHDHLQRGSPQEVRLPVQKGEYGEGG